MNQIRYEIIKSIIHVKDELSFTLVTEDWGNSKSKCSCALGCVILTKDRIISPDAAKNMSVAAELLGVSLDWVCNFMCGFDKQRPDSDSNLEAYELGIELNNYFQPIKHDDYVESLSPEDAVLMMPIPGEIE
jgi:hypothetical protein